MKDHKPTQITANSLTDEEYAAKVAKLRNKKNVNLITAGDDDKVYYYHRVMGDKSSSKIYLSRREVYAIEAKLPAIVKQDLIDDVKTIRADRDLGMLLSFTFHVLGGINPIVPAYLGNSKNHFGTRAKYHIPKYYQFDYKSYYIEEVIKLLKNTYKPELPWGFYSRYATSKAIEKTMRLIKADAKYEELQYNSEFIESEIIRMSTGGNDIYGF